MQRLTFDEALAYQDIADHTTIYGLAEPAGRVAYIGRTVALHKRLLRHLGAYDASPKKNAWIASLLKDGKRPDVAILEVVKTDVWREAERRWVSVFGGQAKLLNATDGGDDWCVEVGMTLSEEHKRRIGEANRGRKHSPEFGQQISERLRGRTLTAEHRRRVSEGLKGHPVSAETRERLRKARAKRPAYVKASGSTEANAKRSETMRRRWAQLRADGKTWR